ncbi:MAG TPA: type II toxin-antitoxin system VapC family toxin [Terriglobales bacterium]|nr:type II toxin-antitoxin system VapC family toxin [Terriglobales bacterium]
MKKYALDANALLDFLDLGPGAQRVRAILHEARQQRAAVVVSVLNWGEIFYLLWQKRGEEKARETIAALSRLPIEIVPVDLAQAMKAGEFKAVHKIPYVDCIAAALSTLRGATLVTSDRDFEKLGRHFPVLWITRP